MSWLIILIVIIILVILLALLFKFNVLNANMFKIFTGGRAKKISLITQEPWFSEIKSGRKKVEARVGLPDLYKDNIGKKISVNVPGGEKIKAIIKDVRHYKSLEEYLKSEKWEKVAPHVKTEKEALQAYLDIKNKDGAQVYDPKRIKDKGGIVAIEIELVK